jgi:uncharacterized protein with HEPN domain
MNAGESALRLTDYLGHMLEAASLARGYVSEMTQSEFLTDRRTQQAVVLNLITLGEAAARVSNEHRDFAESHPKIPWGKMRGMRNRMAHGYFDIDLQIVWDTVQSSLQDLEVQLQTALSDSTRQGG